MSQEPTARLMVRALQAFENDLQAHLHAEGFGDVTVAQTNILRHLDPDGMSQQALAHDANVSKQAVSQALRALKARELVAVEPDPDDARARRVVYTDRGRALIAAALPHIVAIEGRWREALGDEGYEALRHGLERLPEALERG